MVKAKVSDKILEREKVFKILKELFPDVDLNDRKDIINTIDSFIFTLLFSTSTSEIEIVGRLEILKHTTQEFIKSEEFEKWQEKVAEEILKEKMEKTKTSAM